MDYRDQKKEEFVRAYDELADPLFRLCFFKTGDREKAKDLMQETFTKVWSHLAKGKEIENLKAFLYKSANNLIIDHYRKKNRNSSLDELMDKGLDFSLNGSESIENLAEFNIMVKFIGNLPDKHKEVVVMRFLDDMTPKEISEILKVSENVVSVRLNRALKQLKNELRISHGK